MITIRTAPHEISCEGHSGYAEAGADIVCAAVTSAMRFASAQLDVLGVTPAVEIDERRAYIRIASDKPEASSVFRAFALLMREFEAEYPEFICVRS